MAAAAFKRYRAEPEAPGGAAVAGLRGGGTARGGRSTAEKGQQGTAGKVEKKVGRRKRTEMEGPEGDMEAEEEEEAMMKFARSELTGLLIECGWVC